MRMRPFIHLTFRFGDTLYGGPPPQEALQKKPNTPEAPAASRDTSVRIEKPKPPEAKREKLPFERPTPEDDILKDKAFEQWLDSWETTFDSNIRPDTLDLHDPRVSEAEARAVKETATNAVADIFRGAQTSWEQFTKEHPDKKVLAADGMEVPVGVSFSSFAKYLWEKRLYANDPSKKIELPNDIDCNVPSIEALGILKKSLEDAGAVFENNGEYKLMKGGTVSFDCKVPVRVMHGGKEVIYWQEIEAFKQSKEGGLIPDAWDRVDTSGEIPIYKPDVLASAYRQVLQFETHAKQDYNNIRLSLELGADIAPAAPIERPPLTLDEKVNFYKMLSAEEEGASQLTKEMPSEQKRAFEYNRLFLMTQALAGAEGASLRYPTIESLPKIELPKSEETGEAVDPTIERICLMSESEDDAAAEEKFGLSPDEVRLYYNYRRLDEALRAVPDTPERQKLLKLIYTKKIGLLTDGRKEKVKQRIKNIGELNAMQEALQNRDEAAPEMRQRAA